VTSSRIKPKNQMVMDLRSTFEEMLLDHIICSTATSTKLPLCSIMQTIKKNYNKLEKFVFLKIIVLLYI